MLKRLEQKKERRKKIMMGFVLVFLMIFSVMGIIIGQQGSEVLRYNDYKFEVVENVYYTTIEGETKGFNYFPSELENLGLNEEILMILMNAPMIYFTFNPESEQQDLVYIDLVRKDLTDNINKMIIDGMTTESEIYNLPIISCENSTSYVPVIYFNQSINLSVKKVDDCIVLNAKNYDFLKLRDLLIYKINGVME